MKHTIHRPSTAPAVTLATLALAFLGTLVSGAAAAEPTSSYQELYAQCIAGAPRSADAHEAWSMRCHGRVGLEISRQECVDHSPTSADARDIWSPRCRDLAAIGSQR
jgi:hypothetical protein